MGSRGLTTYKYASESIPVKFGNAPVNLFRPKLLKPKCSLIKRSAFMNANVMQKYHLMRYPQLTDASKAAEI